jgi:hypothetical protein
VASVWLGILNSILMDKPEDIILAGDCLIYRPSSFFGWVISIKTWHFNASHCEMYAGNGSSFAARSSGVNLYPFRRDKLAYVLRPAPPFDFFKAENWFYKNARGQGYDWLGVFSVFTTLSKHGNPRRQWCSELLHRLCREGGSNPFSDLVDADTVAPFQFLTARPLQLVWSDGKDKKAHWLLISRGTSAESVPFHS